MGKARSTLVVDFEFQIKNLKKEIQELKAKNCELEKNEKDMLSDSVEIWRQMDHFKAATLDMRQACIHDLIRERDYLRGSG